MPKQMMTPLIDTNMHLQVLLRWSCKHNLLEIILDLNSLRPNDAICIDLGQ